MAKHLIIKSVVISTIIFSILLAVNQAALAQAKCYKLGKEVPCEELKEGLKSLLGWVLGLIVFGIVAFVFWISMIVHAATKPVENKAMWIVLMVFTSIFGALAYYFAVKRKFNRQQFTPTV